MEHHDQVRKRARSQGVLISRIVGQAQRDGVPLSEIERKMLYFSETCWTLPDIMSVNEAFDRDYNQDEYEKKIKKLVRAARIWARKEAPQDVKTWSNAIRLLGKEDHYLSVMVGDPTAPRHPVIEWLKPVPIGLGICMIGVFALGFLQDHFPILQTRNGAAFVAWGLAAGVLGVYLIVRVFARARRTSKRP